MEYINENQEIAYQRKEIIEKIEKTLEKGFDYLARKHRKEIRRHIWEEERREAKTWALARTYVVR